MAADATTSPPQQHNGGSPDGVKEQAAEQAKQTAEQAKSGLRDQVDQRSTQAGEQITSQVSDARTLAEELRKQGKDGPARLAEQAADRAERVGSWLTESDADRLMADVEDYARKNPWTVAAGGLALGFLASRFLKASSDERLTRQTTAGQLPAPSGPPPTAHLETERTGRFERAGTAEQPPSTGAL